MSNEEYKVLLIVILPLTGEYQTRVGITASIEHSSLFRQSVTHPMEKRFWRLVKMNPIYY